MNPVPFDTSKLFGLFRQNDVKRVGLFGSASRGDFRPESDIDMLIEFSKEKSLLKFVKLERQLSEKIGRKVDLQSEAAISPYLIDSIKRDLRIIYEA